MKKFTCILLILGACIQAFGQETDLTPFIIKVSLKDGTTLFDGSQDFQEATLQKKFIFRQEKLDEPQVPYGQNSLLLFFTAAKDYNEFSYYLEGYDEAWSDWSIETAKQYLDLEGEKFYIFHVKTRNPNLEESQEALFKFYISPPWYRTFWAYVIYVMFTFLILRVVLSVFLQKREIKVEKDITSLS
jgi:hypothetical protein